MSQTVTLKVFRYRSAEGAHFDTFEVNVPDAANVLDAMEQAWDKHDRDLMFRHACHHASCGTCAVRINGAEKLPCIAPVSDYVGGNRPITIEPLRNFPLVGDLVVDMASFFGKQEQSELVITRPADATLDGKRVEHIAGLDPISAPTVAFNQFEDCIECGICLSACPTMAADYKFFGPAGLAGIKHELDKTDDLAQRTRLLNLADDEQGVWRCHSAWECTEACPQQVNPAEAIMDLRRQITARRFKGLWGKK